MTTPLDRRTFCRLAAAGGLLAAALPARADTGANVDLDRPASRLDAFLKIYTSVGRVRVWYWYSGVIDVRLGQGAVMPIVGTETLVRRDMTPLGDGRFDMRMFEGTYYRQVDGDAPLDRFVNPLNGREVRPFHYREGPYHVGYAVGGPYDPRTGKPFPGMGPFKPRFARAEDQLRLHRDNYIDVPHPLPASEWPLESSGPRQSVGSFATHWASAAEVGDPSVATARSAFHYEAVMGWLPWMLMADAPGDMVWRCAGSKLPALDAMSAAARAGFEATHPRLFAEVPWDEHADLFTDYRALRSPAAR